MSQARKYICAAEAVGHACVQMHAVDGCPGFPEVVPDGTRIGVAHLAVRLGTTAVPVVGAAEVD